jgi:lipoprotein-anchoring transpeptidase ErfK/SrfK
MQSLSRQSPLTLRVTMPLVLGLFAALLIGLSGCADPSFLRQSSPTATPFGPGEKQDIIPEPTATATLAPTPTVAPTVTPRPTATPTATPTPKPLPAGVPAAPTQTGRVILVSLSRQQLFAYQDGSFAFSILVETGRPELPTPTGVFHVFYKECSDKLWTNNNAPTTTHNVNCPEHNGDGYAAMFISPWPQGSPYYYYPTHINYALEFKDGGFYLHDAWWHVAFGPGSNVPHQLPDGTWETGSHGCVGMRTPDAEHLYGWAANGTPVYVKATA